MNPETIEAVEKGYQLLQAGTMHLTDVWVEDIVFSWRWWVVAGLTVFPWLFWYFTYDRSKKYRLLTSGLLFALIASQLDFLGVLLGLWAYEVLLLPAPSPFIPWDFCGIPVASMTFLQYKPNISPFIKAPSFAGIAAFIAEPLAEAAELYHPTHWSHIYSFFIFTLLYLLVHYIYNQEDFKKRS